MYKVLCVDDDPNILEYITDILENLNFKVIPCSTAEAALDLGSELDNVQFMFTDIRMPGINGFQLISKLRQLGYNFPMYAISGIADLDRDLFAKEFSDKSSNYKPTKFIRKPFNDIDIITEMKILNLIN